MSRKSRRPSAGDEATDPPDDARSDATPDAPDDRSRGVRVRLTVRDPPHAPVAEALPDGAVATDVRRIRDGDAVVSAFRTDRRIDAEPVFAADGEYSYRLRSAAAARHPCEAVESLGHPVSDVSVRPNPARALLGLSLPSAEPVDEIIEAIEGTGASATLEQLTRSGGSGGCDPVVVDRGRLTDRQREVVRTAQRLGYFEYPRDADAEAVAAAVGIARSTFSEHLAAAQRRVFDELVDP